MVKLRKFLLRLLINIAITTATRVAVNAIIDYFNTDPPVQKYKMPHAGLHGTITDRSIRLFLDEEINKGP